MYLSRVTDWDAGKKTNMDWIRGRTMQMLADQAEYLHRKQAELR